MLTESRNQPIDILVTAIAPILWGGSYLVTTELLPNLHPLTIAMLRALPAGLLLLLLVRMLPSGIWLIRMLVLGALNFSIFWTCLFYTAQFLPGGVAATLGSVQALFVFIAARILLGAPILLPAIVASLVGLLGVALIVLSPDAELNVVGITVGIVGAISMALGTVLSRKWQPPTSPLTFTAWQLTAGGALLVPAVLLAESGLPTLTGANLAGLGYLSLFGAAGAYILWFRGIARITPASVSLLAFLSPVSAVALGWLYLGQVLTLAQLMGVGLVLVSIIGGQIKFRPSIPIKLKKAPL